MKTGRAIRMLIRSPFRLSGVAIALVLLLLFNLLFTDGFFQLHIRDGRLYGSLIDVLDRAAPLILVSLGMCLVIGTAGVDLSVGAVMAVCGAVAAGLLARGGSLGAALGVALAAGAFAGTLGGFLVAIVRVSPIVATLTLMVAGRGVAQLVSGGQIITTSDAGLAWLGNGALWGLPASIWVWAAALVAVGLLVRRTALGLFVEAVGDSPAASLHAGVPATQVKLVAYGLSGLLAGAAGVLAAADIQAADANSAGLYIELDAILAVVLGGTALAGGRFSLVGTVVAALLLQSVLTTVLSRGIPLEHTLIVKAGVIVAIVLAQSPRLRGMLHWRRHAGAVP